MQKHFAFVTGIAMLAVAGIVVTQQGGVFPDSMRGALMPSGSTSSTGYTDITPPPPYLPSSSSAGQECQYNVVNGIITECCRVRYSINYTCRHFADNFTRLCQQAGITCGTLDIHCNAVDYHHRVNTAVINGTTCIVEPQGAIISCEVGTTQQFNDVVCGMAGLPAGCDCSTRSSASSDPSDFTGCALNNGRGSSCESCCDREAQYHINLGDPDAAEWVRQCKLACNVMSSSASSCAYSRNCVAGYTGSCNPTTCLQLYNTGQCIAGGTSCLTLSRTCENSAVTCGLMSSSSSSSSGCESCSNACSDSTPAGEICCNTSTSTCDIGTGGPMSSSMPAETCSSPDYNPPSCSNENNPPPFSTCGAGFHIVDQGCQEGTCGCTDSSTGPKIRCQHRFVCERI